MRIISHSVYKIYHFPTCEELYLLRKPTKKDLKEIFKKMGWQEEDAGLQDVEIYKIRIYQ
jgi:hypothetical protein